jgi:hypothetical protein
MEQKHLTPTRKGGNAKKTKRFFLRAGERAEKKMLDNDVGSRNVIENKGNYDI